MKLSLVGFSLLSTLAGATKEDCYETLQGDDFTEFFEGIEDANPEDIPTLCSDIGGDFFSHSGSITCENGEHEDVIDIEEQFKCLPTTCTDDKDVLGELIVGLSLPDGSDPGQCFGSFEYEGLGDGIPQPMQCNLDLIEVSDEVWTNFYDAVMDDTMEADENDNCEPEPEPITCGAGQNQCSGHYGPGGDGNELLDEDLKWCCASCNCKDLGDATTKPDSGDCNIKYTNAARVCEENHDMDFFTYSRSTTLNDGTIEEETDVPTCLPSSCTSDEDILKAVLVREGSKNPTDEHSFVFTGIGPAICMDPPKEVKFEVKFTTSKMKRKNCVWARKNAKKRCNFPEIEEGCPMTCGGCDSTEKFLLDNREVRKSCEWAKRNKTSQRCRKSPTSEMCPSVCESWPSLE